MKYLILVLFLALIPAQLTGIPLMPGVYFYIHDIVLCALLILTVLTRPKGHVRMALLAPIVGFVVVGTVSLVVNSSRFASEELLLSSLYLVRWTAYAGIYAVVRQLKLYRAYWVPGLAGVGTAVAVLGLAQYVLYPDLRNLEYLGWDPHYYRLFSTLLDPNFAGILLVLAVLLIWSHRRLLSKQTWIAALVVTGTALYLTYSRSSYLAFFAALGVYGSIKASKPQVLILALVILVGIVWVPRPGGDTLRLDRFDSTISRLGNWTETIERIGASPVFGYGFNTLRYVHPEPEEGAPVSRAAGGVDSSILFVLITMGVAGLGAVVWLLVRVAQIVKKGYGNAVSRDLSVTVAASFAAIAVHSLFSNSAFYPWVMIWVWILVGILENAVEQSGKKQPHL